MSPEEVQAALDAEAALVEKELADEGGEEGDAGPDEDKAAAPESTPAAEAGAAPEDLGEYKADDPEVAAKFDGRYFTEEGRLNKDTLSAEFWANAKDGQPGRLNEGTYAYLEARLGVSKDLVQDIERGLVAAHQQAATSIAERVHAAAGGADRYNAAIKWANEGGYTEAQGQRLNRLIQSQAEGWEDAVEALVARHEKANPGAASTRRLPPGPPQQQQRRSSPARQAGTEDPKPKAPASTGDRRPEAEPKVAPYKSADEYYADLAAAGSDPGKLAETRTRLKVSPRHVWSN